MAVTQYPAEWEDIIVSGAAARTGGAAPTVSDWGRGFYAYEFQYSTPADEVHYGIQFSHGCKQGLVTISPHLHIATNSPIAPTQTITFNVAYTYASIGSQFPAIQTLTASYAPAATVSGVSHTIIETADIAVTVTPSSMLCVKINRPTDSYGSSSVWLLSFDVHAQMDSKGSQQEYLK